MKNSFLRIIGYFFCWRVALFLIAFFGVLVVASFGGRFPYADRVLTVTNLPSWIWGFGNFDGVHYLRIAQNGYTANFSQAFFPVYPFLIKIFNLLPKGNLDFSIYTDPSYFYTGMVLSAVFFILALYFLFRLWSEEYGSKTTWLSIILLLTFPTSFYFGSVYSESIFLLLTVLTFWFVRKDKFILAGVAASFASATKIQGSLLFIYLLIELIYRYKDHSLTRFDLVKKGITALALSVTGLASYMFYLWKVLGDPVYFLTSQPAFGADRSSAPLIPLPQVFYRYIKILTETSASSLAFWNASLELFMAILVIIALVITFKKVRFSYWIFALLAVLMPTLTGTFSSIPRYVLLAFPILPAIANFRKAVKYIIIAQVLLGAVLIMLFTRGYWVA